MKRWLALVVVSVMMLTLGPAEAKVGAPTETGRFYNILPPGQHGSANSVEAARYLATGQRPAHFDDQLAMYGNLVYNSPGLADADIEKYFKRAGFTVDPADVTRVELPRPGLTIVRDKFDVPHIYGDTAEDVFFGTGYVTGQDRLFVTDVLRHLGRGRLSEFLGASEANIALDRDLVAVAGYSEEELQLQADLIPIKFGTLGELSVQAVRAFTLGMNQWITEALTDPAKLPAEYPALQVVPAPWKVTDTIAIATLIQAIFAAGGGGELANARLQQTLAERYPAEIAHDVFRDLLNREDPDAPVTTEDEFPYQGPAPIDPDAVAIPDPGSYVGRDPIRTLRQSLEEAGIGLPGAMSNWLAVTAENTADGHPIGVMGPQTGYFSPNLLMEIDIHGGGYDARGATFPGISMFVLLGRGVDFAWSATSGGSDLVDIRIEKLCAPDGSTATADAKHYLIHGICTPMYERVDRFVAKPSAGGIAEPTAITHTIQRTAHGPVIGRATVKGDPVAVSLQRSTFFGEADSSPAFIMLNSNKVHDPETFYEAMNYVTGTFNWLYVDEKDVAFYHSGLYPRRAQGVDNELPTWGTGEWEWRGYLPLEEHPRATNPESGYMTSWNNKPARQWRASDANYAYSPVYRSQSLAQRLEPAVARGGITITDMIDIMEDAATVDLRGAQVLPDALAILQGDAATAAYTELLADWVEQGAHRRASSATAPYDRQAAVALMDAWWDRLIHAVFDDELDGLYGTIPLGFDDGNRYGHLGSAFQGGFYGHTQKALRQARGEAVGAPYRELSCGGSLEGCRAVLSASLLASADALMAKFGAGPEKWVVDKTSEDIRHSAIGVLGVPAIDWQNRPTFQQVVQVQRART